MKKWAAVIMIVALMITTSAQAAQWPEGRSAAQPYAGTPPVNLDETMGYILLYPRPKMPAHGFCDRLQIYLPREDIVLARGALRLMKTNESGGAEEVASIDFSDAESVLLRSMTEQEMESVIWGSGVCIEVFLPESLTLNETGYYVTMDEGCFTARNGALSSLPIVNPEAWMPVVQGECGVSRLYYVEPDADEATEEAVVGADDNADDGSTNNAADESANETPAELVYKARPEVGDRVCFDLVMGGHAAYAVIYSENDSVFFDEIEYTQPQTVEGTVTKDEVNWGVVFLDGDGNMVKAVSLVR